MISYSKKAAKILRARIQRLGTPAHLVEAMTVEMLVNLYKMSKRLAGSGTLERHREAEAALLVERARGRVLDVGCGVGKTAFRLAHANPELSVTGLDIDDEKIEVARELAEESGVRNLVYAVGNMFEPKGIGPFDTILCKLVLGDVLEHSGEPAVRTLLATLRGLLAKDGRILLADLTAVRDLFARAREISGTAIEVRPVVSARGERTDTLFLFELV